jgi:hypothetical protein
VSSSANSPGGSFRSGATALDLTGHAVDKVAKRLRRGLPVGRVDQSSPTSAQSTVC